MDSTEARSVRSASRTWRARVPGILLLAGAFVLCASLVVVWYTIEATSPNVPAATQTFYPSGTTVTIPGGGSSTETYGDAGLPASGAVMNSTFELAFGAASLGAGLGVVTFAGIGARWPRTMLVLALACALLAVAAPIVFAAELPPAICSDVPPPVGTPSAAGALHVDARKYCSWYFHLPGGYTYAPGGTTVPGDSFAGHSAATDSDLSWGPGPGWFGSVGAAALLVAGATLLGVSVRPQLRARRRPGAKLTRPGG